MAAPAVRTFANIRKYLPVEVYPLMGALGFAVVMGISTASYKLVTDPHLRHRGVTGINQVSK
ncbi:hypothetical protein H4R33_006169 [Dimargaris cristalligena]|nr:hypothetical protein H4R33_006169 [Dimargaris cristalligena]